MHHTAEAGVPVSLNPTLIKGEARHKECGLKSVEGQDPEGGVDTESTQTWYHLQQDTADGSFVYCGLTSWSAIFQLYVVLGHSQNSRFWPAARHSSHWQLGFFRCCTYPTQFSHTKKWFNLLSNQRYTRSWFTSIGARKEWVLPVIPQWASDGSKAKLKS